MIHGDGLQMLPLSWLAIMRGVDGIGTSGNVPHWRRSLFPFWMDEIVPTALPVYIAH